MKVFIIGNGFDSMHKMETSYTHFREFLQREYNLNWEEIKRDGEFPELPSVWTGHHGDIEVDDITLVNLMGWLLAHCKNIGTKWQNFEGSLGDLDLETILDENTAFGGDDNYFHEQQNYEDIATTMSMAIEHFPDLFQKWIDSVEIARHPNKSVASLFDADTVFLTFNYTETLEVLYGIERERICYIHGRRKTGDHLMVGHGNDNREFKVEPGAEQAIYSIQMSLRKKTDQAIQEHGDFFSRLSHENPTDIYSFGFSFSDVDMVYIQKICNSVDTSKITWHLNNYDDLATRNQFKAKIVGCGFKGRFTTY